MSSRRLRAFELGVAFSICALTLVPPRAAAARASWTELNIGPYFVDSEGETAACREVLTRMEQLRWVLGNLLESKDLNSLWPIRILITKTVPPSRDFVWQHGQYLLAIAPGEPPPLDQIAGLLLDSNSPRLPAEVETGARKLFSTLEAHGSHVTWGSPPSEPDLGWARMQLFATKPQYSGRLHIFLTNLRDNTSLSVAERNAFGEDPASIEKSVRENFGSRNWQSAPVSGRPLDPKRDFGEHSVDALAIGVFLGDLQLTTDRKSADAAYKAAIEAKGNVAAPNVAALGYEGMAQLAALDNEDPKPFLDDAASHGSRSAPVYFELAKVALPVDVLPLLKRAELLNPMWSAPVLEEANQATDPAKKEELLKKAAALSPRSAAIWQSLAELQLANGHVQAAQGTWLRAENAAATDAERDRIHQSRLEFEENRLDALEQERRRTREAARADDLRAQSNEAERIHAAEQRANEALEAEAGGAKPQATVDWSEFTATKVNGKVIRVDCLGKTQRLTLTLVNGKSVQLLVVDPGRYPPLTCGSQQPPLRVSVSYFPKSDTSLGTTGEVTQLTTR